MSQNKAIEMKLSTFCGGRQPEMRDARLMADTRPCIQSRASAYTVDSVGIPRETLAITVSVGD